MTQPKQRGRRKSQYTSVANGPLWLHVEALERIGVDPDNVDRVIADAQAVDGWVLAENTAQHGELVGYATAAWPSDEAVDRLNNALALLEATGRVRRVG